ncbi:DUF3014 domain-containing protein [Ramlibacter tataouinensis]|nr:DUF3014 domain-containing protein [Ramlibacter tataouinensis]
MTAYDELTFRPPAHQPGLHPHDRRTWTWVLVLGLLVAVPALLWLLRPVIGPAPQPPQAAEAPAEPPGTEAGSPTLPDTAIRYPLPAAPSAPPRDFAAALRELLGRRGLAFLQAGDLPSRFVATVDSLGREHAAPASWPVLPTPGRFSPAPAEGQAVIAQGNAERYAPFVAWIESLDVERTVGLYRAAYPLFQQAYRELGFGDRHFNDRLVEVIDLLLASPEPVEPIGVQLTEVKGPLEPERPWVRYEFTDARLQALPAGQKIMVRMGTDHQQRLKDKLGAFRRALVAGSAEQGVSR